MLLMDELREERREREGREESERERGRVIQEGRRQAHAYGKIRAIDRVSTSRSTNKTGGRKVGGSEREREKEEREERERARERGGGSSRFTLSIPSPMDEKVYRRELMVCVCV